MNIGVLEAINAVQSELAEVGITKRKPQNSSVNYAFRSIDDVYNTLSPILAKHKLAIIPRYLSRSCEERKTQKGAPLFYVTVDAEFDFVSAKDGSKYTAKTFGEAMDTSDKATNKAMSIAYKYACFQVFAIPTEGDNDPDATQHAVAAVKVYPQNKFEENFPKWDEGLTSRKITLQQIEDKLAAGGYVLAQNHKDILAAAVQEAARSL